MSTTEFSAGAILFRETRGKREYLLLKSRAGDWEFPKGKLEDGEELQQAAIREVTEETGISEFQLIDGFRDEYSYSFQADGETVYKTVHLFIARANETTARLSREHHDHQWRTYSQAKNTITQDGPRENLVEAHEYLNTLENTRTEPIEQANEPLVSTDD